MTKNPPIPTIPEIALVTDMSGECKAGATPQTTRYPIKLARAKVNAFDMNIGLRIVSILKLDQASKLLTR